MSYDGDKKLSEKTIEELSDEVDKLMAEVRGDFGALQAKLSRLEAKIVIMHMRTRKSQQ